MPPVPPVPPVPPAAGPPADRTDEPSAGAAEAAEEPRKDRIAARLASILSDLSGVDPSALDPAASFADLGFDSLFLTQANAQFRKQFGVRITFRQIFEEAPSINSLAGFIDSKLDPTAFPAPARPATSPATAVAGAIGSDAPAPAPQVAQAGAGDGSASPVERLIREQLRIMEQQLAVLRNGHLPSTTEMGETLASGKTAAASLAAATGTPSITGSAAGDPSEPPARSTGHYLATRDQGHRPAGNRALTDAQRAEIDALIRRADARTSGSKRLAQLWRPRLADNRAIVGFDPAWKELVYQVVSERSKGSRLWDVDGNEYIDTALGFGTNLFGHSPDFVVAAVREQLDRGFAVGVQSDLLGEVAELACSITGNDRLAFTTSGGEAVETAIRVARTVSGRDRIAYFTDDIHGRSDIVLGRAVDVRGDLRTVPMVAGVPQRVVDDAFVLEYGTDRALDVIREQADELALVLVEPVRSRNPDLQPQEFLRELRRLADAHGFVLVFDEIVTGFRAHQRGVQGLFDIKADITTYGKVMGGGLPVGVVAGASRFIDVIDGGSWAFGDDSFPEADITASGGTMIKHALTLAASRAVLTHLREEGPELQAELNQRTTDAVGAINGAYTSGGVPIHVEHFSSFFRPTFTESTRFAGLFQYYLRERGIHSNPPSPSFLSTAHTAADVEAVVSAYVAAGQEMDRHGFLRGEPPAATHGIPAAETVAGETAPSERAAAEAPLPLLPNVARFLTERSTPRSRPLEPGRAAQAVGGPRPGAGSQGRRAAPRAPSRAADALPQGQQRLGSVHRADDRGAPVCQLRPLRTARSRAAGDRRAVCRRDAGQSQPPRGTVAAGRDLRPGRARTATARDRPSLRDGRAVLAPVLG